jgi:hypothetical protein
MGVAFAHRALDTVLPPRRVPQHAPPSPQPSPQPDPGAARFVEDSRRVLSEIQGYVSTLSPRDQMMMRIGLHASHLEEALVSGDFKRAESHLEALGKLVSGSAAPPAGSGGNGQPGR